MGSDAATRGRTRRTTLLVPADVLDRLDRLAGTTGRTKTGLVTDALRAYLDASETPRGQLPFVGIGRSGHGRLSLDAGRIAAREIGEGRR